MKIERPGYQQPTEEELKELDRLKGCIEQAAADGVISCDEIQVLRNGFIERGNRSADQIFRELELYRSLVTEKIRRGELSSETLGQ